MKNQLVILTAAAGLLMSSACSVPKTLDQMKVGLWASRQNLWDEAIFRWRRALEFNPGSAAAHNNLAVAYELKGRWADARKEYEAALVLDPKNPDIKSNFEQFQKNLEPKKPEPKKKEADEKRP